MQLHEVYLKTLQAALSEAAPPERPEEATLQAPREDLEQVEKQQQAADSKLFLGSAIGVYLLQQIIFNMHKEICVYQSNLRSIATCRSSH